MKYSAIEEMFYGKRGNQDNIKRSEKYSDLAKAAIRIENEFLDKLKTYPELFALYEKLTDCENNIKIESVLTHYREGFRFGLLIACEAFFA